MPLIAGIVVVLAIAGGAVWYFGRAGQPSPDSPAVATSSPAYEVVVPFLAANDWSDGSIADLNAALLELPSDDIASQTATEWFQGLLDEVRRRLKEQQALATQPLTPEKSPLAALAVTIGIDLARPDAAIRIADSPERSDAARAAREEQAARRAEEAAAPMKPEAAAPKPEEKAHTVSTETARPASAKKLDTTPAAAAPTPTAASAGPAANADACKAAQGGTARPFCRDALQTGGNAPRLAVVPSGTFEMGGDGSPAEKPVHRVEIRKPFAISVNEVSQGEFQLYCERAGKSCPTQPWAGEDYPVVGVSWTDARDYVRWLSTETGQRYRLPTESEWEYAARAGQTGAYPGGKELSIADAHFSSAARLTAAARRSQQFNPNAWKLMHVLGNAREWVEDSWVAGYDDAPADGSARDGASGQRVARGGSYADGSAKLRLSSREGLAADTRDATTGFRVVRELP